MCLSWFSEPVFWSILHLLEILCNSSRADLPLASKFMERFNLLEFVESTSSTFAISDKRLFIFICLRSLFLFLWALRSSQWDYVGLTALSVSFELIFYLCYPVNVLGTVSLRHCFRATVSLSRPVSVLVNDAFSLLLADFLEVRLN